MSPVGECGGRVALVTGASRGIGAAIAERLAAEGANVVVSARSLDAHSHLPGTLQEVVAKIESRGGRAGAVQCDLSDADQRADLVARAEEAFGPIDILVNNAAAAFYMPFEKFSSKRLAVAIALNLAAPFDLCQRALPGMRERGRGWVVNVSSATAKLPEGPPFTPWEEQGGDIVYGATKAALDRFTAGLAAEVWREGVAVNALAPVAAVLTPGVQALGVQFSEDQVEPVEAMAEAALALCTCDPATLNGRVSYSRDLLGELGREIKTLDGSALYRS